MAQPPWLLLCLLYSLAVLLRGVCARVASLEPLADPPPVTEAPQAALGKLHKRDSPICGYLDGIAQSSLTCNAPNDCYIFTAGYGFYSAKGACGQKAISSYNGPWGLCVNYGGGLCPDVASCSSAYTSVLFCPPSYPYCVRYEMRDTPSDPFYYVLLDCTTVHWTVARQILFTPTTTESTLALGPTTPSQVAPTTVIRTPAAPSSTPTTPAPTMATPSPTTANNPTPTATPTNTEPSPTTTPSPNETSVTVSNPSPSATQDVSSSSGSTGLTVGDKAGIAGAIVGAVAIFTGIVSVAFPHETRIFLSYFLCCCCARRSVPTYSSGPIPMNQIG